MENSNKGKKVIKHSNEIIKGASIQFCMGANASLKDEDVSRYWNLESLDFKEGYNYANEELKDKYVIS